MTLDSEVQVFQYPHQDEWLRWPLKGWEGAMFLLLLFPLCLAMAAYDNSSDYWYYWLLFVPVAPVVSSCIVALRRWERRAGTGRIEVTDTTLARYFSNATSVTLAWNDVMYSMVDVPLRKDQWLKLTSEAGAHKFFIHDTVGNFSELRDIIRSKSTQHSKDIKRG